MQTRTLGTSNIQIAPLALGGNVFGWTIDEPASFKVLDAFVAAGFNLIDTADVYSRWKPGNQGGESETVIGNWLKRSGKREQVVIATKVGSDMGPAGKGLSSSHIRKAVEDSLRRLQTDYIDLYQSHRDDPDTPIEETLSTYADLVKEGKVRLIGASNFTPERLRESLRISKEKGYPRYHTLQPEYNLYDRAGYEQELQALCIEESIGVIPYYGLASGFLSGKYRSAADASKSQRGQSVVQKYVNPRGLRILAVLDEVAAKLETSVASVALAWLAAQPGIAAPIASATTIEQLHELAQSADIRIQDADVKWLTAVSQGEEMAAR